MAKKDIAKQTAVEHALAAIRETYGPESIMTLKDNVGMTIERVSSGSLQVDKILGGGYPMGRVVEIFGPESSGKTTLTLHAVAEAQKKFPKKAAAFIDAEHALDPDYAAALGVDLNRLLIVQPDSGEQALDITEALIRSGDISIVVIDSVDALTPMVTIKGEMGDRHVAPLARLMSQAMRKLAGVVRKTGTLTIFVNQIREKVGVIYGSPETTVGGRALKFYSTIRLEIRKQKRTGETVKAEDKDTVTAKVKCIKNKVSRPFLFTFIDIKFGKGVMLESEVLDLAVEYGIVHKGGSWFSLNDEKLGQGRDKVIAIIEDKEELFNYLYQEVREHIIKEKV